MAIKQRSVLSTQNTTLSTNKDTAFPDNNNKEITAADLRTWLNELLSQVQDILDSYFNKLDELRITSTLDYDIVATPADWNGGTAPATQNLVNDELAGRVKTIEVEPNQTAFETPYTITVPSDWDGTPNELQSSTDELASRMRVFETNNFSDSVVYVSKQGDNSIAEVGNQSKPFLTIQAAINAMPVNNSVLKVLGGGNYNESITIPNTKTNSIFDFGNCTITNIVAAFSSAETNNNLIQNLFITNPVSFTDLRSTFLNNVVVTSTNQFVYCYSKYVLNCSFTGSNGTTVITTVQNTFTKYWNNCIVKNTGTGGAVYRSPNTIFNNCYIESGVGFAYRSSPGDGDDITKISRLINCAVKSDNYAITGESLEPNILAYNTKFYSSGLYPLRISNNSKILLFDSCEFYSKAANPCVFFSANILRTATQNYVFKDCTFHTITGFPFTESAYNAGDLGTTLVLNCIANKATMTSIAPVKITENNSFFFANYTDFNNLQ